MVNNASPSVLTAKPQLLPLFLLLLTSGLPTSLEFSSCVIKVLFLSTHQSIFFLSSLKELQASHFPYLNPAVCQGPDEQEEADPVSCLRLGIGSSICRHLRFKRQREHGLFPVYGRLLFPRQLYLSPFSCPCLSYAPDNFLLCVP